MPQSYDLLAIQPLEVTEAVAKSRSDIRAALGRLTAKKGWSNEGKTRDTILANIDEQFIHHGEHYDRMIKGGVRPDGSKYKGTAGVKSVSLEVSEATAEVIVHGSREWEPSSHEYTTRVQFQNFAAISSVSEHTWSERARMLLDDNLLVDCDCNAFRYFHRRAATKKGFALVAEKRAARVRNPRNKGGVCKHLEHALVYMGASYPKLASAMKAHAGRGKVQESAVVAIPPVLGRLNLFLEAAKRPYSAELFHGAGKAFDKFHDEPADGFGHWLSDDKHHASAYAASRGGDHVLTAKVSLKHPHYMTHEKYDDLRTSPNKKANFAALKDRLVKAGHDGIVIPSETEHLIRISIRHPEIVAAFHGKSATVTGAVKECASSRDMTKEPAISTMGV